MLQTRIQEKSVLRRGPDGKEYKSLLLKNTTEISVLCRAVEKDVEITALEMDIIPERYHRSMGSVGGPQGQIRLLKSRAAIIGAGGLGGTVLELAGRMGIGSLVIFDGDVFSDSNLNRQILATELNLGRNKAEEAAARLKDINSAVQAAPYACFAARENLEDKIAGCDVVIDCLDNLQARFTLEEAAKKQGIPLVHGAIAHHLGQVTTIFPEDKGLAVIYQYLQPGQDKGVEKELGNPATTPAVIASLQLQEAMKIILKRKNTLRNRLLLVDIENSTMDTLNLV